MLGWQTSLVGTALAAAQLVQAVIVLYNPSFATKGMPLSNQNGLFERD